ncbi:MAG: hypothetical protein AB8G18_01345 [Gammaproteobacteria bacterium]
MTDITTDRPASAGLRLTMLLAGALFAGGGGVLALAVWRLLAGETSYEISGHDKLFWALCGVVALCLLLLAINFLSAAWSRRAHNVVPGPTLYLLGVTLVILGMFVATSGALPAALVLGFAGFATMYLEYRSEFI